MKLYELLLIEEKLQPLEKYLQMMKTQRGKDIFEKKKNFKKFVEKIYSIIKNNSEFDENFKGNFIKLILNVWSNKIIKNDNEKEILEFIKQLSDIIFLNDTRDAIEMYFRYKNSLEVKDAVKNNNVFNTTFDVNTFKEKISQFNSDIISKIQSKKLTSAAKKTKEVTFFTHGNWKVYKPKTFEEACVLSSISNPENKELNRKANWCTAVNKRYFNMYENIYIIKKEPTSASDKGIMLQMNWGTSKKGINFRNEWDYGVDIDEFRKYNIPDEVLKAIKAPKGHEDEGKSIYDILKVKSDGKLTKEKKDIKSWEYKKYNYKFVKHEIMKNKLSKLLPFFTIKIYPSVYSFSSELESALQRRNIGSLEFYLLKSPDKKLAIIFILNSSNTVIGINGKELGKGVYTYYDNLPYELNLQTKKIVVITPKNLINAKKYEGIPDEVLSIIKNKSVKEVKDVRYSMTEVGDIKGHKVYKVTNLKRFKSITSPKKLTANYDNIFKKYGYLIVVKVDQKYIFINPEKKRIENVFNILSNSNNSIHNKAKALSRTFKIDFYKKYEEREKKFNRQFLYHSYQSFLSNMEKKLLEPIIKKYYIKDEVKNKNVEENFNYLLKELL